MKAKSVSMIGMILGVVFILGMNIGYLILAKKLPSWDEQKGILAVGLSMVLIFSPVYLSIIVDKFLNNKINIEQK